LFLLVGMLVGGAAVMLARGPVSFASLPERVAAGLEAQFGRGFRVSVDDATVGWSAGGPNLAVGGVTIRDASGNVVVAAPRAVIGFDPWSLGGGNLVPRDISFVGLDVALTIAKDGSVAISAGGPLPLRQPTARVQPSDTSFGPGAVLDALLAHDGPVAVLERAGVRDGSLRIDDQRRGTVVDYTDFGLSYSRAAEGDGRLGLSARGPAGRWSVSAGIRGTPGGERSVRLQTTDLALSDIINLAQPGAVPVQTDMPISVDATLTVGSDGAIKVLDGQFSGGKALLLIDDPDAEPVFLDSLSGHVGWDADAHALLVKDFDIRGDDTHLTLSGTVVPPSATQDHWQVELASSGSQVAGEGPHDTPTVLDQVAFSGRMPIGLGALFFDRLVLKGPEADITLSGAVGSAGGIDGLRLQLTTGRMPVRRLLSFWPSFIAADVRTYMLDNVVSGTVERFSLTENLGMDALKASFKKVPVPDDSVRMEVAVSNGVMRPAPGLVMLSGIEATGVLTGRTADVAVTRASAQPSPGKVLLLGKGRFNVADTTQNPSIAQIAFDVAGNGDALLETLRSDALRAFTSVPADIANVKGQVEARARITMPLKSVLAPKDVLVTIDGTAVNLTADGLPGKEKLEAGTLTFSQNRDGLTVKGDVKIGGVPAQLESVQPAGQPSEVVITMVLDEAARAKKGIKLPGQVAGPIDARITLHDAGSGKAQPKVELDLTRASLSDVLPGWTKPAGKAAKVSFRLVSDGDANSLEDFTVDGAGGVTVRGSLRLGADQGFAAARLTSVKLSPGDDIRLDLDRQGSVTKAVMRGSAFDARPLLRALTAPGGGSLSSPGDIDVDAKVGSVTGLNGEVLGSTELKLGLRGGDFRDFRLSARFGSVPVSGQMARLEKGGTGIVLESGDAGSFLRFLDIYRRMLGGTLLMTIAGPSPQMDGTMSISRFVLSNEPALAKSAAPGEKAAADQQNNVEFTKLRAGFSVGGGKLVIRDATMWGQSVGGTLDGTLDFSRDQANLSGTFVPAYGLNNIINQVPVVGPILGGGQHEGLFAVNFRISGRVSQPTLSINPLSAVAPGILRKFFGVFSPEQTGSGADVPPRVDGSR
jgi:hypothetical protein